MENTKVETPIFYVLRRRTVTIIEHDYVKDDFGIPEDIAKKIKAWKAGECSFVSSKQEKELSSEILSCQPYDMKQRRIEGKALRLLNPADKDKTKPDKKKLPAKVK